MKLLVLTVVSLIAIAATRITTAHIAVTTTTQAPTLQVLDTPKPTKKDTVKATATTNKELYGIASFYSNSFEGKQTASGETFRQKGMTCASNNVPLGTWLRVTNISNKKVIVVKVNDRMAPSMARKGRVVDLTHAAATQLNFVSSGLAKVKVEILGKKKPQ
jgi:rare lipoprotein A